MFLADSGLALIIDILKVLYLVSGIEISYCNRFLLTFS